MAEEGTFCINADVIKKAGANVNATAITEAYTNVFIKQAEGRIMVAARADLKSGYAALNFEFKELLKEATSNLAAIYTIQFDMSGFTSRIEAEDMINILLFNFRESMKIISDQKAITYSDIENGIIQGITVEEIDGTPSIPQVNKFKFTNGTVTDDGNNTVTVALSASSGDVVGPASAVDSNIALFDGVTGKLIKDGLKSLSDFMEDLVNDTTPQLGGNLDIQAFNIEGAVAADLVKLSELTATSIELNYVDGVTSAIQTQLNSKLENISEDSTPQLGGELDCLANSIGFTQQSGTGDGTTTIDWGNGNKYQFTFGAQNDTFTFTAPAKPGNFLLKMIQDSTGSRTATWPASIKWVGGSAPTLSTAANSVDIISFYYDGTNYYGIGSLDFS